MITKIKLNNFKCFESLSIDLSNLNVFAGINGMGKSTTIQSLLLLKQSIEQDYYPHYISLNGSYINIGSGKDLLYEKASSEIIKISLTDEEKEYITEIEYDSSSDVLELSRYNEELVSLLSVPFEYLSAERNEPQSIYPKSSYFVNTKNQLGINGQYTAHYLSNHQDETTSWISCDGEENTIKKAVQYWLGEISPNVHIQADNIDNTDLAQLGYYYTDDLKSNVYRPTNVGFGISYVLPVIVALIKAQPGSVVIIENPEAHLHPKGQRRIGELISKCAENGVQVFIETHSDHVLNGIRISVKKEWLNKDKVQLFFFDKKEIEGKTKHYVESPKIYENGKLNYWPDGFFDEWDKALDEII